jgi:predicted Zn-dependent protease with MMP-like domain
MDRSAFVELVERAVEGLPEEFKRHLNNVGIVVEDWPTEEQLQRLRVRGTLFGLYEGVPQTKRSVWSSGSLPDKITIFQKPIEQYSTSEQGMIRQIQQTVEHEIGHHFGLSESEARRRDQRKRGVP